MTTSYKVKLRNFEGPLDLLLFFVRKDELNIYDIPISYITKQYLDYLGMMRELNLDIAAEFILMAATLMRIKVRSMLPPDPLQEEEEEILDPREELTRRLIEYRQFKEASKSLAELDDYWRTVYRRSYFNFDLLPQQEEGAVGLKDISFFDLLAAYKKAVSRAPKPIFHSVEKLNVTVEGQTQVIVDFFQGRTCYLFTDLCGQMGKIEIVVTFLAMLDLIKRGDVAVKQASLFDDIWIYKAEEFFEEDPPGMAEPVSAEDVATLTETTLPEEPTILGPSDEIPADDDVLLQSTLNPAADEKSADETTVDAEDQPGDTKIAERAELGVGHELFESNEMTTNSSVDNTEQVSDTTLQDDEESGSLAIDEDPNREGALGIEPVVESGEVDVPSVDHQDVLTSDDVVTEDAGKTTDGDESPGVGTTAELKQEIAEPNTDTRHAEDSTMTEDTVGLQSSTDDAVVESETISSDASRDPVPNAHETASAESEITYSPIKRLFSKIVVFVKRIFFR